MNNKTVLLTAGILAGLLATAIYAQDTGTTTPAIDKPPLAEQSNIENCLNESFNLVILPSEDVKEEANRALRTYETGEMEATIIAGRNQYRIDDPARQTDQVDFFVRYEDKTEDPAIEIYRSKQISFNAEQFIPYKAEQEGHALYGHYNEMENGRNFTPTEKEKTIEQWVNDSVEAMGHQFETCMGFKEAEDDALSPTFPEL